MTFFFPPRRWQSGDLFAHRTYGPCLILNRTIGGFHRYDVITHDGFQFQTDLPDSFIRATGLVYTYRGYVEAATAFGQGVFTPYFQVDWRFRYHRLPNSVAS